MTPNPSRRGRLGAAAFGLLTITLVPGLAQLPAFANSPSMAADPTNPDDVVTFGDAVAGLANLDTRKRVSSTLGQRRAVAALGAVDVRWNDFGQPSSILPADGVLAKATSASPVTAARTWLKRNAAVFGLTAADMSEANLELVEAQKLADSGARAVLFRQRFGGLTPALGSMVTVGVANGEIAYVSSSLVKNASTPPAATLTPEAAWLKAAANVGRNVNAADVTTEVSEMTGEWTRLTVKGYAQEQQVRLRALAMANGTVRPVFEANVVDVQGGSAFAYTSMVDAVNGDILHRENQVENSSDAFPFTGSTTATECGPMHAFELTDDLTKQISATSVGAPTDDHIVKIFDPKGQVLVAGDLGTNPENATYSAAKIPAGIYSAQVCPFPDPTVPVNAGPYSLTVTTSDAEAPSAPGEPNPKWRFFPANPSLESANSTSRQPSNSVIGCWLGGRGCTLHTGRFKNIADFGPWDSLTVGGSSTQTTTGNNAQTRESWFSPLTPGGLNQAPVSPTREYTTEFTDAWNDSQCNPAELVPGGNDILASVINLFVQHNRMHDYSYYLGFTESNYNLQVDNIGRGGVDGDPEVGNAQAGAVTGGSPSYLGRDNANQITLQDGVPGITNQYLFQPIAGAFYAPCTDGGLDQSIIGHEYTHAISNRMVAGPDEGLTSVQGAAMGESWSDLIGAEYMFSHSYDTGTSPWVVGPYATGNKKAGIRDFPINKNPLNYSNYGFDTTGDEFHADGEIWNSTLWEVRQGLVNKWNKQFPYSDKTKQLQCAQGEEERSPLRAHRCPGNRRWVQLIFDSFLLQQGNTSMLDARDAMIAADGMRFEGRNKDLLWDAFAKRGMGKGAFTPNADSGDVTGSFASPTSRNGKVKFQAPGSGKVYVGEFEARVTPIADTAGNTKLDAVASFVPGTYQMLYASKTTGFKRFTMTVKPGQKTVRIAAPKNLAAAKSGAKVISSTAGSRNPAFLIDGTEATVWAGVTDANVDESHPSVAVDLAGGVRTIRRMQVSAMLTPATTGASTVPVARVDEDPDSGSRFTALRKFAIETCVSGCSSASAKWKRVYVSGDGAFPAILPRPVAPDLIMRSFNLSRATKAAAVRLVALENQCTGQALYSGEQDNDPLNDTDCKTASDRGTIVHAAELQVY